MQSITCYCDGSCICSVSSEQAVLGDFFNVHALKVPVRKIRICLMVCHEICEAQCSHTDANAVVLLHFIMFMQRRPFAVELVLKILFEESPGCQQCYIVSPICCVFCVSCDCIQQNLLLKAFICICQLFSCVGSWDSLVSIVTVLWGE